MMEFILYIVLTSGFIWGVNCLFSENHILEKPGDWMREHWPESITKPLFDCAACMSSLWGLSWFFGWIPFLFNPIPIKFLIPFLLCLCGLNYVIIKLTSNKREIV